MAMRRLLRLPADLAARGLPGLVGAGAVLAAPHEPSVHFRGTLWLCQVPSDARPTTASAAGGRSYLTLRRAWLIVDYSFAIQEERREKTTLFFSAELLSDSICTESPSGCPSCSSPGAQGPSGGGSPQTLPSNGLKEPLRDEGMVLGLSPCSLCAQAHPCGPSPPVPSSPATPKIGGLATLQTQ